MEDESLFLLKELLEIPSVNSQNGEQEIAEYLTNYFHSHGVEAYIQKVDQSRANVVAKIPGEDQSRTVVWNGHLDTVPYGEEKEWDTDPSKVYEQDGKIYARGASDMKSGLAAMVYVLCHTKKRPPCNILFLGTCDEEKGGIGASKALEEGLVKNAEYLLIGEPTGMQLGVMQKGCLWLEISIKGKTSHGAYPQEGINAIDYGIQIANALGEYVKSFSNEILGDSTAQITIINGGGGAWNMTPDLCRICMDIRMVPGLTKEMVLSRAGELLRERKQAEPGLDGKFHVINDRRAIVVDSGHWLPSKIRSILNKYGYDGSDIGINFFTDASILDKAGEKAVLLFGPGEPFMAHKPNEYVSVKKYRDAILVLSEFMEDCIDERLGGQK